MKLKIEDIAKICHEANKALCESMGDFSQAQWAASPAWQKGSAVAGVQNVIDNPSATPEDSHKSWLAMKEAEGWQYGEVKNPELLRHPCMVDYDELSEDQRVKDELFLSICKALIPMADIKRTRRVAPAKSINKKVNIADEEALAMDNNKPTAKKMKQKVLPSGKAMPKVDK